MGEKVFNVGSNVYIRHIVLLGDGEKTPQSYYALVSHTELDSLVGQMMQMCDLIGDIEQRKALKDTIKKISRDWLDNLYQDSGYDKWAGIKDNARVIKAK